MNLENVITHLHIGLWVLLLVKLGQRDFLNHQFRMLAPSFPSRSHFAQNKKVNLINLLNVIIYLHIGVWSLKTIFGSVETKSRQARYPWNFLEK